MGSSAVQIILHSPVQRYNPQLRNPTPGANSRDPTSNPQAQLVPPPLCAKQTPLPPPDRQPRFDTRTLTLRHHALRHNSATLNTNRPTGRPVAPLILPKDPHLIPSDLLALTSALHPVPPLRMRAAPLLIPRVAVDQTSAFRLNASERHPQERPPALLQLLQHLHPSPFLPLTCY